MTTLNTPNIPTLLHDVEKTVCKLPSDVTLGAAYPKLFSHMPCVVVLNPSSPPLPPVGMPLPASRMPSPASQMPSPLSIPLPSGPLSSGSDLSLQIGAGNTVSLTVLASSQSKCVLPTQAAKCKAITSSPELKLSDSPSAASHKASKVRAVVGSGLIKPGWSKVCDACKKSKQGCSFLDNNDPCVTSCKSCKQCGIPCICPALDHGAWLFFISFCLANLSAF